jgi:hypothetical protein
MTLYLWHLPVLIAMVAGTHAVGLDRPVTWSPSGDPVPTPGYWAWTFAFLAVDLALVVGVVRVMWPAEVGPLPGWDRPARESAAEHSEAAASALAAWGAALVGIGTLMISAAGLAGFSTRVTWFAGVPINSALAIGLMALGGLAVRRAGATRTRTHHGSITTETSLARMASSGLSSSHERRTEGPSDQGGVRGDLP